jgi:hypothetical protein
MLRGIGEYTFIHTEICQPTIAKVVSSCAIKIIVNIWEKMDIFYTSVLNEAHF